MISGKKLVNMQILLVEDEPACRHTVETVLEREGASVTIAENAEEAIKLMQSNIFDVVVSDIKLPGMNGISLLGHIRKINSKMPVIMMTGYSSIDSAVEALKLGAQDYLIKPLGKGDQIINSVWKSVEHYRLTLKNESLQEQLKQSEETFRTLFHNASDAIFLNRMDRHEKISAFSEVNSVACSRLGYSRKELQSMTILDITAEEHREDTAHVMETLLEREHTTFETIHVSKDGKRIPVEISAHMFSLRGDKAVLSIARDIAKRRKIEKQISEASEKESRHIGQELHDVLCQDLASIKMLTSVLKTTLESESSKGIRDAEIIRDLASNAVTCTRRLCAGLFPSELEDAGLASALEQLAINHEQLFRIPCSFTNKSNLEIPDKSVALHLYRIAQQAINNAAMHSRAKSISISLAQKGSGVILTVDDDGIGIFSDNNHRNEGMGLNIMKYRARIIGAVLTISRRGNSGTTVECSWQ